jgi:hypothetical protein
MPLREDDRARHSKDDLKYCVVCKQHLAPAAWAQHEHNPKARPVPKPAVAVKPGQLACTLLLGPCAIGNTSGVIVLEGVEVFRLRHRGEDGHIAVNMDIRGPDGRQLAKIERNSPLHLAPGLSFAADGPSLRLNDASGAPIVTATAEGSDVIRLTGDFHANGLHLHIASDSLTIGGEPVAATRLYGPGTAVLIRKGKGISFAKS